MMLLVAGRFQFLLGVLEDIILAENFKTQLGTQVVKEMSNCLRFTANTRDEEMASYTNFFSQSALNY